MNQTALFKLSYGVYVCTSWQDGRPVGCIANSTMQITADPATVAVSISKRNFTHKCIEETGYFAITVLAEDSDPKIIGRFGFMTSEKVDKFAETPYTVRGKLPVLDDGIAYMSCKVVSKWETDTHTVFLGEVFDCDLLRGGKPMTYAYYHEVLKGKTSANAPTYSANRTEEAAKQSYVCEICSYEYDGEIPFEELPDDWVCPICGVGKEMFVPKGGAKAQKSGWVCDVCGYEYDGEIPFEELPDDWVCPICNMGKEHFHRA